MFSQTFLKTRYALIGFILFISSSSLLAEQTAEPITNMDNKKISQLLKRLNTTIAGGDGHWEFTYEGLRVTIITDESANRMRIIVPINKAAELTGKDLHRMMQANFDSALDARYSIAQGILWSAFIHPLSSLEEKEFFSGLAQTIQLTANYGKTYSSGALLFGGGDSSPLQQQYFNAIMLQSKSI